MLFKENKYPIICSAMNGVSDINLAIAVKKAGVVPSLIAFPHIRSIYNSRILDPLPEAMNRFRKETNSTECILACLPNMLTDVSVIDTIMYSGITHVEILGPASSVDVTALQLLKSKGIKLILKVSCISEESVHDNAAVFSLVDAIVLKNGKGAGLNFAHGFSEQEQVALSKKLLPSIKVITSGGISTPEEVVAALDTKADYVSIGTAFAMSMESSMSVDVKDKLLNSTTIRLASETLSTDTLPAYHTCVMFDKSCLDIPDDYNNTNKLLLGLRYPNRGLVYVGEGLRNINSIQTVSTITNYLTKYL